jgi:excisionase family DNA binding protein
VCLAYGDDLEENNVNGKGVVMETNQHVIETSRVGFDGALECRRGEKRIGIKMLIDCHEVAEMMGIGVSTVWAWAKAGRIPQPIRFGTRTTRWKTAELLEFIESIRQ